MSSRTVHSNSNIFPLSADRNPPECSIYSSFFRIFIYLAAWHARAKFIHVDKALHLRICRIVSRFSALRFYCAVEWMLRAVGSDGEIHWLWISRGIREYKLRVFKYMHITHYRTVSPTHNTNPGTINRRPTFWLEVCVDTQSKWSVARVLGYGVFSALTSGRGSKCSCRHKSPTNCIMGPNRNAVCWLAQ